MLLRNNSMATLFARHAQAFQQRLLEHMRSSCTNARSFGPAAGLQETRAKEVDVEKMRKWQIVRIATTCSPCVHEKARAELNQCKAEASQRVKKTIELADTLREIRTVQGVQLHSQMCLCKVKVHEKSADQN